MSTRATSARSTANHGGIPPKTCPLERWLAYMNTCPASTGRVQLEWRVLRAVLECVGHALVDQQLEQRRVDPHLEVRPLCERSPRDRREIAEMPPRCRRERAEMPPRCRRERAEIVLHIAPGGRPSAGRGLLSPGAASSAGLPAAAPGCICAPRSAAASHGATSTPRSALAADRSMRAAAPAGCEYADMRAGVRYCAACAEQRVNTRGANTVTTAEYGRIRLNTRPLER